MMEGTGNEERGTGDAAFGGLSVLLDGYFHEDFRQEYGSHEGAARAFLRDASAEERLNVALVLRGFLAWAEEAERPLWQSALRAAGGAWRPRSLEPLREVLAVVAGAQTDR
jgi:hypothetical protein